jgi:CRP/FNR family transcriptional regulator, cyclic AMP receptor protein
MFTPSLGLSRSSLFAGLSPEHMALLTARAHRRHFAAGEVIFREGDPGSSLLVIESGEVLIAVLSPTQQDIVVATLGAGDMFGELALIDGQPRSATATAAAATDVITVFRDDFIAAIRADAELDLAVLRSLADVIRHTNTQLVDVAMLDVHGRIAKVLLNLAGRYGQDCAEGTLIDHPLSNAAVAGLAGMYPVEVERTLRFYQLDDLVRWRGDRLVLRRLEPLQRAARYPQPLHAVPA